MAAVVWAPNVSVNVPPATPLVVSATAMVPAPPCSDATPAVMAAWLPKLPVKVTMMPMPPPEHAAVPALNVTLAAATVDSVSSAFCTTSAVAA